MRLNGPIIICSSLSLCAFALTYDAHKILQKIEAGNSINVQLDIKNFDSLNLPSRLDSFSSSLAETNKQSKELIKDLKDSFDDNYPDIKATIETNAVITRSTAELIPKVQELVVNSNKQVLDLSSQLLETVKNLDSSQDQLAKVTDDFILSGTKQLNDIGDKTKKTLDEVNASAVEIKETNKDIHHLADTAVIATDPLRKAKNRFLAIAKWVIGKVAVTVR